MIPFQVIPDASSAATSMPVQYRRWQVIRYGTCRNGRAIASSLGISKDFFLAMEAKLAKKPPSELTALVGKHHYRCPARET